MIRDVRLSAVALLVLVAVPAVLPAGARAAQPAFAWQEGRRFDGRSHALTVPHDPSWLLLDGTLVLDFTADRLQGVQGLLSKDVDGRGDGGHLAVWLDEGAVVARLQDTTSDYRLRSPARMVKPGVPARLSLAFGSGGMRLYLDGKAVDANPYGGGLRGNREPLVIGARNRSSRPGAADALDAFFAGTIGGVALYPQRLDAPAIAALGPAGTALAQAAPPGSPVAPPQGVAVQVDLGPTTTIASGPLKNEDIGASLRQQKDQQATQPIQVRSGANLALQPWRTETAAVAMFWDRAKRAAPAGTPDEVRAAMFVALVEAAFKANKSDEELRGLEWWARLMKLKRIEAARSARQAYDDWRRGVGAPRSARSVGVMLGDDRVDTPSYEALLASGFERVSGPGTAAANQSWPEVMARLEAARVELQGQAGANAEVQEILDGVVTTLSLLKDGFTGWTTVAATAYSIASTRWSQVQQAEELPGKLEGFLSFAKATTPSLTESLYTEDGAKQAYVALIESTL